MKDSFIMFNEHSELVNQLTNEQAGILLKGLFEYTSTGKEPELDAVSKIVFISIRQDLDRNAERYSAKVEKMKLNGAKGGRPSKKQETELSDEVNNKDEKPKAFLENQMVFSKSKKSLYDNVNVNVNDNVLSLNVEKVTDDEREILEKYVKKHKLAAKSVRAYTNKLIENGDYKRILEEERLRRENKVILRKDYSAELKSITDKESAAKVLAKYYMKYDSPPDEFSEIMQKYDLDTYDKVEVYSRELWRNKQRQ